MLQLLRLFFYIYIFEAFFLLLKATFQFFRKLQCVEERPVNIIKMKQTEKQPSHSKTCNEASQVRVTSHQGVRAPVRANERIRPKNP